MSLSDFNNAQNLPDGIYPITSDDLTVLSADIISYDNTSSGLSASNTQTAIDELAASTVGSKCLVISQTSIAALPATIQNTSITSDMVCIKAELSNPSAQSGDWTVTTSNGSLSVTGTISGTTDLKMYLVESR